MNFDVLLRDEAATAALGEDIAAAIRPGDLVAVSGDLGAGKTTLARALLRAVAGDPALEVPSPTFPIRIDYDLPRLRVTHADLYRISAADNLDEIGLEEVLADAALIVEWPEKLPSGFGESRLGVTLAMSGRGRRAELTGAGTWPDRLARTAAIRAFLDGHGWTAAHRRPLAGDASTRAYERIEFGGRTAVLMNAPARAEGPPICDGRSYDSLAKRALDVRPFLAVGAALRERGIRAPQVYAEDAAAGLLLLEDLGSEGILDATGEPIQERYEAAVDLLAAMHSQPWPEFVETPDEAYRIPAYDREALLIEASLFPDWFGGHGGEPAFPPSDRPRFLAAWSAVLDRVQPTAATLVLRDYHSPNILWQEDAGGLDRVAVIDFQDALLGHPAYDVASLVQDARAPVSEAQELALKRRYVTARSGDPGFDEREFEAAYAVFAAQRATKVLGAFTRLALVEGKPGYQRHRQRLKGLLSRTLKHPVLSDLRVWYEPYL